MDTRLDYASAPLTRRRKMLQKATAAIAILGALAILAVLCIRWFEQLSSVAEIRRDATQPFTAVYSLTQQDSTQRDGTGTFVYSRTGMKVYNHVAQSGNGHDVVVSIIADATMGIGTPRIILKARTSTYPSYWPFSHRQLPQISGLNIDADILYSGQSDAVDASHFTIKYGMNGETDIIDGWVTPDGTVKLETRNKFR